MANMIVLLPYKITLFSNVNAVGSVASQVLLPYKITLFSNVFLIDEIHLECFTTL